MLRWVPASSWALKPAIPKTASVAFATISQFTSPLCFQPFNYLEKEKSRFVLSPICLHPCSPRAIHTSHVPLIHRAWPGLLPRGAFSLHCSPDTAVACFSLFAPEPLFKCHLVKSSSLTIFSETATYLPPDLLYCPYLTLFFLPAFTTVCHDLILSFPARI